MTLSSKFDKSDVRSLYKLLAVSPSLAVTDTLARGLAMSCAVIITLVLAEVTVSVAKKLINPGTKYSLYLVIAAFCASFTELLLKAFVPAAANSLGVYLTVLAVSCVVMLRLEKAAQMSPPRALEDAIVTGGLFLLIMLATAFVRELFGKGTLACGFDGNGGIQVFPTAPLPILALPAGVLLLAAFGTAVIRAVDKKLSKGENR